MSYKQPRKLTLTARQVAIAAGSDGSRVVARAPFAGTVSAVYYTPDAAWTGDTTNTRTLSIKNRGAAGAGTTVVATLALVTGVNGVAFDDKTIPVSGTAADLIVAKGDVLSFESIHAASGVADPGGLVTVEFTQS